MPSLGVILVIYIIPYYLYGVIQHYDAKQEDKEMYNRRTTGNRHWSSGSKV